MLGSVFTSAARVTRKRELQPGTSSLKYAPLSMQEFELLQ
jgi:hypothetical protein